MKLPLAFILLFTGTASAQLIVTAQNAASFAANSIAPGSIIAVQIVRGGPVVINPDPSRITVKLRSRVDSIEYTAPVLQATLGTTLALVPKDIPIGPADLLYTTADASSALPVSINILPTAFGLFTNERNGVGPALALNSLTKPAAPGDFVTLWGTGLGNAVTGGVTVEVAGLPAPVSYAGPAPGFPGLDQINIQLPPGVTTGCYVSVVVKTREDLGSGLGSVLLKPRESTSNETTIAIASEPGACKHPFGLTQSQMQQLDGGGTVLLGRASLRSQAGPVIGPPQNLYERNQAASVELARRGATEIQMLAQPLRAEDVYFGCKLVSPLSIARFTSIDNTDAGPALSLTGPDKTLDVPRGLVPILYLNVLPVSDSRPSLGDLPLPFFSPGTWKLSGTGGSTHGAFDASLRVPPPIRWTNRDALTSIDRTADQTVTWQPDGYSPDDLMTVTISTPSSASLVCRAPASAGQLLLPSNLLQQVNAAFPIQGVSISTLEMRLTPRPEKRAQFDLPRTTEGSDRALFEYLFTETQRVNLR